MLAEILVLILVCYSEVWSFPLKKGERALETMIIICKQQPKRTQNFCIKKPT